MACGTPVIAFNRGSVPEIVENGLTGFIVERKEETVVATDQLSRLSRGAIRRRFEERFTARRMAREYLNVYRSLIEKRPYRQWPQRGRTTLAGTASIASERIKASLKRNLKRDGPVAA